MLTPALLVLGSKQYSAAIAFTLALFSHLINHVNIRLQAELEEGENPVSAFQSDGTGRRLGWAGWDWRVCMGLGEGGTASHVRAAVRGPVPAYSCLP